MLEYAFSGFFDELEKIGAEAKARLERMAKIIEKAGY